MLKKTNKIDIVILLTISLNLCESRVQHNLSITFDKNATERKLRCGFIDQWVFWKDCSQSSDSVRPVNTSKPDSKQNLKGISKPVDTFETKCTFFQRFVFWDYKSCGPEQVPPYSSTCTELEHYFMEKMKCEFNPDEFLDGPQIIARLGFNVETHQLITEDNYILEIHRIPSRKSGAQPLLLQHGIFGSSADWVINGENSIGILLAKNGYDVWMANSRGNTYSDGHTLFPNHSPQYWNFSFDEMALKDVHSVIMYITQKTQMDGEIIFIGHGTGALLGLMYSTTYSAEMSLIKLIVTLGPTVYSFHMETPLTQLVTGTPQDKLSVLLAKRPSGVSSKTITHLLQLTMLSEKIQRYDYGSQGNLIAYGGQNAEEYALENIKVPVYIMYSLNDWFSKSNDVNALGNKLQNLDSLYVIQNKMFGHLDYLVGKLLDKLVLVPLLDKLSRYPVSIQIEEEDEKKENKKEKVKEKEKDKKEDAEEDGVDMFDKYLMELLTNS